MPNLPPSPDSDRKLTQLKLLRLQLLLIGEVAALRGQTAALLALQEASQAELPEELKADAQKIQLEAEQEFWEKVEQIFPEVAAHLDGRDLEDIL